jgi:hypothetical protein
MKNRSETIRKMVSQLNNPDADGGFWLPNIQRPFVWNVDQIARLFDSLLRLYPISTLLVWKTTSRIRHRRFIDNYKKSLRLSDFYVPENTTAKRLVLDGQQRLQSLFIGLLGSYEGHEMCMDILSGDLVAPEDIRYRFEFRKADGDPRWILFKNLVFSNERDNRLVRDIAAKFGDDLTEAQEDRIEDNISQISKVFKQDEVVVFQELDSIDNPDLYREDDVVEVFIRANSGGTRLAKSDLLFSLLSSSWDESDERMETLLEDLNRTGYEFNRDFVLKTCLTLLKTGARYNVDKLRRPENRAAIIDNWDKVTDAIRDVKDFLYGKTYIRSDKALPSYLSLIPLIYFRYHYQRMWATAQTRDEYILRTLLGGTFSGNPDELIDGCTAKIDELGNWDTKEIFGVARHFNRSLEVTRDTIFSQGYGSKLIHLLFNLWYRDFNYAPAFENNHPQVDHIFPQSLLRTVKRENPETGRKDLLQYYAEARNQLANCMLLSAAENGAGGKSDTPPDEWFADKEDRYLEMHLIPKDPTLRTLDRFEDFVTARAELIAQRFDYLLVKGD